MNAMQFRKSSQYEEAVNKIKSYPKGFKFTMYYNEIPKAKVNALKIVLNDCCDAKLLSKEAIGINLDGDVADETFIRL